MTKLLLNSGGFVIEIIFFYVLRFQYRGKNFLRRKRKNFARRKVFTDKIFTDKVIVFLKSVVAPSKIRTVINFYGFP